MDAVHLVRRVGMSFVLRAIALRCLADVECRMTQLSGHLTVRDSMV
jgi:hypothetical protein